MDIKLDKKSFKALANDTRIEILKLLSKKRYTQSELAEKLNFSVPTVKEHLEELVKAELIEKNEEGRKWKYFSLTEKGKGITSPEEKKILLLLLMTLLSVVGGVFAYLKSIPKKFLRSVPVDAESLVESSDVVSADVFSVQTEEMIAQDVVVESGDFVSAGVQEAVVDVVLQPEIYLKLSWVFCFIAVVLIVMLVFLLNERKKRKELLGKILTKKKSI